MGGIPILTHLRYQSSTAFRPLKDMKRFIMSGSSEFLVS